jgi:hypothetical protein
MESVVGKRMPIVKVAEQRTVKRCDYFNSEDIDKLVGRTITVLQCFKIRKGDEIPERTSGVVMGKCKVGEGWKIVVNLCYQSSFGFGIGSHTHHISKYQFQRYFNHITGS